VSLGNRSFGPAVIERRLRILPGTAGESSRTVGGFAFWVFAHNLPGGAGCHDRRLAARHVCSFAVGQYDNQRPKTSDALRPSYCHPAIIKGKHYRQKRTKTQLEMGTCPGLSAFLMRKSICFQGPSLYFKTRGRKGKREGKHRVASLNDAKYTKLGPGPH